MWLFLKDKLIEAENANAGDAQPETKSSSSNVLPMDKLKSGTEAAGKFFGSAWSVLKEKTAKAGEAISSNESLQKFGEKTKEAASEAGVRIKNGAIFIGEKTKEASAAAAPKIAVGK